MLTTCTKQRCIVDNMHVGNKIQNHINRLEGNGIKLTECKLIKEMVGMYT